MLELGLAPFADEVAETLGELVPSEALSWEVVVLEHGADCGAGSPLGRKTSASFAYQHARSREGSLASSPSSAPQSIHQHRSPSQQQLDPELWPAPSAHHAPHVPHMAMSPPSGPVSSLFRQTTIARNRSLSPLGSLSFNPRGDAAQQHHSVGGSERTFHRSGSVSHVFSAGPDSPEPPTVALLLPVRATSIRISTPVSMRDLISENLASARNSMTEGRVPRVVRGDSMDSATQRWARLGSGVNLPPIEVVEALLQVPKRVPSWKRAAGVLATPLRLLGSGGAATIRVLRFAHRRPVRVNIPKTGAAEPESGIPLTGPSFRDMMHDLPGLSTAAPSLHGFASTDAASAGDGGRLDLHAMRSGGVRGTAQEPSHYRLAASSCEVPHLVEDCQHAVITATGFLSTSEVLLRGCSNVELRIVDCRICAFDVRGCRSLRIVMQDSLCTSVRVVGCCDVHIEIDDNVGCSLVAACNRGHMEVHESGNVMGNIVALPPSQTARSRGAPADAAAAN
ncbi:MAG: hypothetical protein WDW38_009309 [Sanguina aurantia]